MISGDREQEETDLLPQRDTVFPGYPGFGGCRTGS